MGFFKKLLGKSETVTPTLNQYDLALEPIVLQAIEKLYPDTADQRKAIEYSNRYKKYQKADTLKLLLSLLAYSDGKIEKLLATEPDAIRSYQFMLDEVDPRFPDLKAAEEWVRSITKPQV